MHSHREVHHVQIILDAICPSIRIMVLCVSLNANFWAMMIFLKHQRVVLSNYRFR